MAERGYYFLCLTLGRLLRSARYSKTRIVHHEGGPVVRKRRSFHAPLLVWLSGPLVSVLDTGVRVLGQREWEERERQLYGSLHGGAVRVEPDGTLVLPCLTGRTLASVLEDRELVDSVRRQAIEHAVLALAELHAQGFTHADAMAENVMVDPKAGVAHWFDFETAHDPSRPLNWRRADDVRALLASCLLRTAPERLAETLHLILEVYPDERVTSLLASSFTQLPRRPLTFHLAQAGLSFRQFREITRLLAEARGSALRAGG